MPTGSPEGQQGAEAARWAEEAQLLGGMLGGEAWLQSAALEAGVRGPLLRLAAHYLLRERRRWADTAKRGAGCGDAGVGAGRLCQQMCICYTCMCVWGRDLQPHSAPLVL